MARRGVHGTQSTKAARSDLNGFVNRRSGVQSAPPAQGSENSDFTRVSATDAVAGFRAGTATAKKATAAIAWLIRNLSAVSDEDATQLALALKSEFQGRTPARAA